MYQHALATFMLLVAASGPVPSSEAPVQELRTRIDKAVQVLKDKPPDRRAQIRKIADEVFDFPEMAKRALGVHWKELGAGDQERFVRLFSDLLDRAYFDKIDSYNGEKVEYLAAKIDGDLATVPTRVVTDKGTDIPVEYRMRRASGRWVVHDVIIEGVSLVQNYRAQFDRIIRTASVPELMKRLEAHVAGQASPRGEPRAEPKARGAGRN